MNEREVLNQLAGLPESAPMPGTVTFIGGEILALYFDSIAAARQFAAVVGLHVSPEPYFQKGFARRQVSVNGAFHGWRVSGSGAEDVPADERAALLANADDPDYREAPQHFGEMEAAAVEAGGR